VSGEETFQAIAEKAIAARDAQAEEFAAATAAMERVMGLVVRQRDAWIRLFNRLDAAVNHHKRDVEAGGLADDPDERLWKAQDRVLRDAAQAPATWPLTPNDPDEQGDDAEDHEDRDEVGVADSGEHESPPGACDVQRAERLAALEAMVDQWLGLLQVIVAGVALLEPDLPPRHRALVDGVLATSDEWWRSR
jgi:hypothetical protein